MSKRFDVKARKRKNEEEEKTFSGQRRSKKMDFAPAFVSTAGILKNASEREEERGRERGEREN